MKQNKKKMLCIIISLSLCVSLSPSLLGASLVRHKFCLIPGLANRQITGHRTEKKKKKSHTQTPASVFSYSFVSGLSLEIKKTLDGDFATSELPAWKPNPCLMVTPLLKPSDPRCLMP